MSTERSSESAPPPPLPQAGQMEPGASSIRTNEEAQILTLEPSSLLLQHHPFSSPNPHPSSYSTLSLPHLLQLGGWGDIP